MIALWMDNFLYDKITIWTVSRNSQTALLGLAAVEVHSSRSVDRVNKVENALVVLSKMFPLPIHFAARNSLRNKGIKGGSNFGSN